MPSQADPICSKNLRSSFTKPLNGLVFPFMAGQHEEVAEPSFSGRSRFCRPALEILKRLILSGDTPQQSGI